MKNEFVRNAALNNLAAFCLTFDANYEAANHLKHLINALMELEQGKINKLMVSMPPRHGKSYTASKMFSAWYLAKNPSHNIIFSTYSQEFANENGRFIRNLVNHELYEAFFPKSKLASDSASVKKFDNISHGSFKAVGAGGSITGAGANVAIIDDAHKNRAEASSPVIRNTIIDWFKSTLYTRLSPEGKLLLIGTRWHESDLLGYLQEKEGDEWRIINMPALDEENKPLWPEQWPKQKLDKIRSSIGEYEWSALYMQRPVPRGGGLFQRNWFEVVDGAPAKLQTVRYWDRAASVPKNNSQDPDYTVGVKVGKDKNGIFYVLDVVRIRALPLEVTETIQKIASQDGYRTTIYLEQDPGQAGKMEIDYLTRQLQGFIVKHNKVTKDKVTRAEPVSSQCEAGNIKLVRGAWNEAFLSELEVFPYGSHDDQVDAFAGAVSSLFDAIANYEKFLEM